MGMQRRILYTVSLGHELPVEIHTFLHSLTILQNDLVNGCLWNFSPQVDNEVCIRIPRHLLFAFDSFENGLYHPPHHLNGTQVRAVGWPVRNELYFVLL